MVNTINENSFHKPIFNKEEELVIWQILQQIPDPEIPVITITDLGIVQNVLVSSTTINVTDKTLFFVQIIVTPTYTGCPATDFIAANIKLALMQHGYKNITITTVLAPAWTTDWITEQGKQKLLQYGIAPPNKAFLIATNGVPCPQCQSSNTVLVSEFGSTPCKALYKCHNCLEPFDYFKCH